MTLFLTFAAASYGLTILVHRLHSYFASSQYESMAKEYGLLRWKWERMARRNQHERLMLQEIGSFPTIAEKNRQAVEALDEELAAMDRHP